jgi:hypothetical protein
MDSNFWAQLCNATHSRAVSELKQASNAANGFAVSRMGVLHRGYVTE